MEPHRDSTESKGAARAAPGAFADAAPSFLAARTTADELRAAHRRLFREMIREELKAGRPTYWRRRAMVRFARSLGIGSVEAKLLIRGVEYEIQLSTLSPESLLANEISAERTRLENVEAALRIGVAVMLAVLYVMLARWLVRMLF